MKYSGVPELLSYTASIKAIHGDRVSGTVRPPRRKLGEPVQDADAVRRRKRAATASTLSSSSSGPVAPRDASLLLPSPHALPQQEDVDDVRATTSPFGARGVGRGSLRSMSSTRLGRSASPLRAGGQSLVRASPSFEWQSGTLLGLGKLTTGPSALDS